MGAICMITLCLSFLVLTPIVTEAFGSLSWWVNVAGLSVNAKENYLNIGDNSLSAKQLMIINNHNSPRKFLDIIASAANTAIIECQRQFKHRKWNCSSNNPYNVFGKILQIACRETAFAYAITAAAVTHSISKACAEGKLKSCTCGSHLNGKVTEYGWQWGGCSDNIRYADKWAKDFLTSGEKYKDFRTSVNIHNNEAGKTAVRSNMRTECKCHGLSKACTLKTCWKQISKFRVVGTKLKEKFDGASEVEIKMNSLAPTKQFIPKDKRHKPPTHADLVYYEESPDFCTKNSNVGSLGTVGRVCNETSMGTDGCALMCCGRGYTSELRIETKPCHCEFVWCCKVICQECDETKNVRICS